MAVVVGMVAATVGAAMAVVVGTAAAAGVYMENAEGVAYG